jgi:hypothetical protein
MTHLANKSVQEFLNSDGWSIAAENLKGAAASFSDKQQGCCPKDEVLQKFRRALRDGTLIAINEDGAIVAYRAQTDYEREQEAARLHNESLHKIRQQKARAPKPSSPRRNPAPSVLFDPDPDIDQNNDDSTPYREPELVLAP